MTGSAEAVFTTYMIDFDFTNPQQLVPAHPEIDAGLSIGLIKQTETYYWLKRAEYGPCYEGNYKTTRMVPVEATRIRMVTVKYAKKENGSLVDCQKGTPDCNKWMIPGPWKPTKRIADQKTHTTSCSGPADRVRYFSILDDDAKPSPGQIRLAAKPDQLALLRPANYESDRPFSEAWARIFNIVSAKSTSDNLISKLALNAGEAGDTQAGESTQTCPPRTAFREIGRAHV